MLLVEAYASVGQHKRAAEILQALLADRPDSAQVRFDLAMTYGSLGSLDAAVRQYREGLRLKAQGLRGIDGASQDSA